MTPEDRSLLEKTYKLTEENHKILLLIRRTTRVGLLVKLLYWTIIIALSLGTLYAIRPYFGFLTNLGNDYDEAGKTNTQSSNPAEMLQDLLK